MSGPATVLGHLVECANCHVTTTVAEGRDVHDALICRCCPDHSSEHVQAGLACRPVIIHANAVATLTNFGG